MKRTAWIVRKWYYLTALSLLSRGVFGQDFPPAQGPPLPPPPPVEFGTFVLTNFLKNTIQTTIDTLNAQTARDADATGINAHLSFSLKTFSPGMSTSKHTDRPNQNGVRLAYLVTYDVTGIRYHGIPYFSRKIGQSIEMFVTCDKWFTDQGQLVVATRADRPFLDANSFAEEALNFFVAHTLADVVESKLRARLPESSNLFRALPNTACNCIGVTPGTGPNFTDGAVNFKKVRRVQAMPGVMGATVTLQSIKRLTARVQGAPLYKEVEDLQLEVYVNQESRAVQLDGMREGDTRMLTLQTVSFPRPGQNSMVVVIANVEQKPLLTQADTRYAVFKRANNFGNGTQKLVVQKTYWEPPHRLPDGRMSKPIQHKIDAYELTYQVSVPQPVIIH